MAENKWTIAVIAAGCLGACGLAGVKSFAKTGDPRYPEDAQNAINVSGDDEGRHRAGRRTQRATRRRSST